MLLRMYTFGCNDFLSGHAQPGHVTGRGISIGSLLLHWQAFPVTDVCFLSRWSQKEEAEMKVRIGKERARCKNVNLGILITTMVIIRDTTKIKYAACLRDLYIQLLLDCYLTS